MLANLFERVSAQGTNVMRRRPSGRVSLGQVGRELRERVEVPLEAPLEKLSMAVMVVAGSARSVPRQGVVGDLSSSA